VVLAELARPNVRGWYRNPSRAAVDSLGVAYRDDAGNWHSYAPRLRVLSETSGQIVASIVDPHGHHLDDAATKLKALAVFATDHRNAFHRIEAVAQVDGRMKVIDMAIEAVREAVLYGKQSPVDIYRSNLERGVRRQGAWRTFLGVKLIVHALRDRPRTRPDGGTRADQGVAGVAGLSHSVAARSCSAGAGGLVAGLTVRLRLPSVELENLTEPTQCGLAVLPSHIVHRPLCLIVLRSSAI